MSGRRPIAEIRIGSRHRKELGDLAGLAASIQAEGLLQPVGVTAAGELVFGERRLVACRDHLGWSEIDARVVPVSSIAAGEYAENELRKDFTPSERVAILETIERMKQGRRTDLEHSVRVPNVATASKAVGFGSESTARNAQTVVRSGVAELVAAMDRGAIGIRPAAEIARLPDAEQRAAVAVLPARGSPSPDADAEFIRARTERRQRERKARTVTIPWSAVPAARILAERWPASLCRELIEALQQRLVRHEAA